MPEPARGRFRPGAAATLATLCALAVLLSLGIWQLRRMEWKHALIARVERQLAAPPVELVRVPAQPADLDWRRVRIRAVMLEDRSFAWGLEAVAGEAGARLVTPARLAEGGLVLVDRGFVAERDLPPDTPASMRADGPVVVEGVARSVGNMRPGWFTPADDPVQLRFWRLDPEVLRDFLGENPPALLIVAERAEPPHILGRVQPVRPQFRDPHLGYALTWFGLAGALLVIYVLFGVARGRRVSEES